nr:MAG TPA: Protein of unknown function (DUF1619) [Caudoviricetes sp.]
MNTLKYKKQENCCCDPRNGPPVGALPGCS